MDKVDRERAEAMQVMQRVKDAGIDLHALANEPGAGKASDRIRSKGFWDGTRAPSLSDGGGEIRTYRVRVDYSYRVSLSETLTVEACNEDQAEDVADDVMSERLVSHDDCVIDHVEVITDPS